MNLTRKEFFKRANRDDIYDVYTDTVFRANQISQTYIEKLELIRRLKRNHRVNTYIWQILDQAEQTCSSSYDFSAFFTLSRCK